MHVQKEFLTSVGRSGLTLIGELSLDLRNPIFYLFREEITVQTIDKITNMIRDTINQSQLKGVLSQNAGSWRMLCSSLDVIEDSNSCLDSFLMTDISIETENQHLDDGKKYMYLYGTLQALFVQQDAVEHLAEALQFPYTLDSSLKHIRDIRNDSVGHPTKRGSGKRKTFNFITRVSIDNQGVYFGYSLCGRQA